MKKLAIGIVSIAFALVGCSKITMLRTEEMKAVGSDVQTGMQQGLDSAVLKLSAENDSLRAEMDSLKAQLEASALVQKRMMAEVTMLSRRMGDESERNDSRQEEIIYRLDMLLGKSDKILAKKVVVSGAPAAPISMDSLEREAEKLVEAEAMFNTARSDYHRGEYKLAYAGFKQVYEHANQVEKAKEVFTSLADAFPEGQKVCTTMFKLAAIYSTEGNIDMQKQYLQKILNSKTCSTSGEFEQAAEILQEILEQETQAGPKAAEPSNGPEAAAPTAETPAADAQPAAPAPAP